MVPWVLENSFMMRPTKSESIRACRTACQWIPMETFGPAVLVEFTFSTAKVSCLGESILETARATAVSVKMVRVCSLPQIAIFVGFVRTQSASISRNKRLRNSFRVAARQTKRSPKTKRRPIEKSPRRISRAFVCLPSEAGKPSRCLSPTSPCFWGRESDSQGRQRPTLGSEGSDRKLEGT